MPRERLQLIPRSTGVVRGRPTLLTEALATKIADYIVRGVPLDSVCDLLSISNVTYWQWMKKGEQWVTGDHEPPEFAEYGMLYLTVKKAVAEYKLQRIDSLHRRNNYLWTRDMAILERRDRKNFSRYDPQGGSDEEFTPDERFI